MDEAKTRFVNRANNNIFTQFVDWVHHFRGYDRIELQIAVASRLGLPYKKNQEFSVYILGEINRCLEAIEAIYDTCKDHEKTLLSFRVKEILEMSEGELSIKWEEGRFLPVGQPFMDEQLVESSQIWLEKNGYESVLDPLNKGLRHFLLAENDPSHLPDVITDLYEALEALAKIVTGRSAKELSANKEIFWSKLNVSDSYKRILGDYIDYANLFRHAAKPGETRKFPSKPETESFIYLTCVFIRLTMETSNPTVGE